MSALTQAASARPDRTITIMIDGDAIEIPDKDTTANELLRAAGLDPLTHYLIRVRGKKRESFEGQGGDPLKVRRDETFISLFTGPTPTS